MAVKRVHDILIADPAVAGIVGDRVFPLLRPQDFPLPAVTLTRVSLTPVNTLLGPAGIDENRLQVDSWDTSYAGARALASACRAAIEAAGHLMMSEMDNFDSAAELSGVFRITQELSLWI